MSNFHSKERNPTPPDHRRLLEKAMADTAHRGPQAPGTVTPTIDELASVFPDYELLELIGRGGMGSVFKATQANLQRPVAIKILPTELANDPEFGERFLREAQTLATLNHPSILTVHDYGERNGTFFLVTEFVDGVNLRQLMELGELSAAEALRIAPEICVALQFAHERGVVHRDIKPENILVDVEGRVKIADFGLAKVARPGDQVALTRNTAVLGTPHYMAPEQWQGAGQVDHRADIYSLGVVLYEMLTGNLPLGHFDAPSERAGVPRGLDAVVRRALAQQPENRYQNAGDIKHDVESQAQSLKSARTNKTSGAATQNADARLVKLPFVAMAMLLAATVAIGLLIYFTEQERRNIYRFDHDLAVYHESASKALEAESLGQPIADIAEMPLSPAVPWFSHDCAPIVGMSLIGGTLLLVMLCGFSSIRTIRNSNGKKRGMVLALLTAWIVPFGIALVSACLPLSTRRVEALNIIIGTALFAAVIYGAVRFFKWELQRQQQLLASSTKAGMTGLRVTLFVLMGLAFGNSYDATRYLPIDATDYAYQQGPTFAADLVGRSREWVKKKLGPPEAVMASQSSEAWGYRDGSNKSVKDAIVFAGNNAVSFNREHPVLAQSNVDVNKPHAGQTIDVFVREYGPPVKRFEGSRTTEFHFENGMQVVVSNGRVLGIRAK